MPLLMVVSEGCYLWTKRPIYLDLCKRWAAGTTILFAVGAVSGTVLSFELGLLCPKFIQYAGGIIGMPFIRRLRKGHPVLTIEMALLLEGRIINGHFDSPSEIEGVISPRIKCSRFECDSLLHLNRELPGSAVYDLRQSLKS